MLDPSDYDAIRLVDIACMECDEWTKSALPLYDDVREPDAVYYYSIFDRCPECGSNDYIIMPLGSIDRHDHNP